MRNRGTKAPPAKEKAPRIDNTEAVLAFRAKGGRILHVHPEGFLRGVTFAFVAKGNRITFATGVQHTKDAFTRKIGTKTAIEHFNEGKVVVLPFIGRFDDPFNFLFSMIRN